MEIKHAPSLKALAESKAEGVTKVTTFRLDPRKIEFEPGFNLREEGTALDAHLEQMYQAMKAGVQMPVMEVSVVEGRIIAREGHCRTRCAKRMWEEGTEYYLEARQFRGNDADAIILMLGSALGKPLTPMESGRGYLRLLKMGLKVAEIASKTGVSRTTIDSGLALAEAPMELQQAVVEGTVAATVVRAAIREGGTGELVKKVRAARVAGGKVKPADLKQEDLKLPPLPAIDWEARAAKLREAVDLLLGSVDYVAGNCQVYALVGAALPQVIIAKAREILEGAK